MEPAGDSGSTPHKPARLPERVKAPLRPLARKLGLAAPATEWWQTARSPWSRRASGTDDESWCNVCRWSGSAFRGTHHVESAACPRCGAIARDRFLLWCFTSRTGRARGARVLETSPRLGADYREMMRRWFRYQASDYDLSAHRADVQIDLQDIALPDASVDVVLTPHVLEHVPDTDRALAELRRVIAPHGRMYLQVPLLRGATAAPTTPEFHADNTPVFWNFGWDLTDRLRAAGFRTTVLVTAEFARVLRGEVAPPSPDGDIFDVSDIVQHARPGDLAVVADDEQSRRMALLPAHQFVTWECIRP